MKNLKDSVKTSIQNFNTSKINKTQLQVILGLQNPYSM